MTRFDQSSHGRPNFQWIWCVATFFAISTVVNLGILFFTESGSRHQSIPELKKRHLRASAHSEPLAGANSAPKCMNYMIGYHKELVISHTISSNVQENVFTIQTCENVLAAAMKSNAELIGVLNMQKSIVSFLSEPVVNAHVPDVMHAPRQDCGDAGLEMVVAAVSDAGSFQSREFLRNASFGSNIREKENNVKFVFIIGVPESKSNLSRIYQKLKEEMLKYDDILQANVGDSCRNDSLKIMSFYHWASKFCSQAKYVIVSRENVTINIPNVVTVLKTSHREYEEFIIGRKITNGAPNREVDQSDYVSELEYPNERFPSYLHLGVMAHPVSTMKLLYQAALRTTHMASADVFFTGVCARKVNVSLLDSKVLY